MFHLSVSPEELIIRSVVTYLVFLVLLRVFGKREVGQFTLYDLVFILLVANALQPAMTGPDTSLGGGLLILGTLVLVNFLLGLGRIYGPPGVRRLLAPQPTVIAKDGRWLEASLRREGLTLEDCEMALREHGLEDVGDIEEAVLEPDGTISVIPKAGSKRARPVRRRVRMLRPHR
jgi:uncharacterized membrane protein YcaP (DUF421 family)